MAIMRDMQVAELKTNFSDVLEFVRKGGKVAINYGRSRKKLAVIIPYREYHGAKKRRIGVMENRATYSIKKNFTISDNDFLSS